MSQFSTVIHTRLWHEEPCANDPFTPEVCRASGYDVYGDLLGKVDYIDYLHLLFTGERPTALQSSTLKLLAVALANPGPRDPSVHAAMAAGATGNPCSSSMIAAIAAGAGSAGGAREVLLAMQAWASCGTDLDAWRAYMADLPVPRPIFWPASGYTPGFAEHGVSCARPVLILLERLCQMAPTPQLLWLAENRLALEASAGIPLAQNGVAAAAFTGIGMTPAMGEMLTLLLRLPGAAAHALEQSGHSFRKFPFFELDLQNDPRDAAAKESA